MNFRNNQGYAGVDISISILILVILIPILGGIVYNISKSGDNINKKTYAMNLATNILEVVKGIDEIEYVYSKSTEAPENSETKSFIYFLNSKIQNRLSDAQIQTIDGNEYIVFTVQDQKHNHYKAVIEVTDFVDTTSIENPKRNVVKKVNTNITYNAGGKIQTVQISTVISKK